MSETAVVFMPCNLQGRGKNWLVLSDTKGNKVIYRKVFEGCGAAHEIRIEYPVQRKDLYDPMAVRLSRSFGCSSRTTSD